MTFPWLSGTFSLSDVLPLDQSPSQVKHRPFHGEAAGSHPPNLRKSLGFAQGATLGAWGLPELPCGKAYPLVIWRSYWKWPLIVDFPINSMVIFHSYVELPEGTTQHPRFTQLVMPWLDVPGPWQAMTPVEARSLVIPSWRFFRKRLGEAGGYPWLLRY